MGNVFAGTIAGGSPEKMPKKLWKFEEQAVNDIGSETERTGKTITDFFKGPEPIKPPTPTEPAALPTVEQDQAGDDAARRARRRSSFRETILTGSLKPQPKGKTVLG